MFTLVPSAFFSPENARQILAGVVALKEDSVVNSFPIPYYNAVLVYSEDEDSVVSVKEIESLLLVLPQCEEYNKIVFSLKDGVLYLAIAQGRNLLLANYYMANDFTTAQYYIFLAIKSLQINPEVSTITSYHQLSDEEEMSLYRYFKSVVLL